MDLPTLKLNRFMYRSSGGPEQDSPEYMSSEIYSGKEAAARKSNEQNKKDAKEVITGTVITACLIKSSDQDDRIEIGQNLQSVLDQNDIGSLDVSEAFAIGLDYLVAYRPGSRIGFILTGVGMVYVGYGMPATKAINLRSGQTEVLQTTSESLWTMTTLGTGVYKITHNLNSLQYSVSAIPIFSGSPTFRIAVISNKGLNSFDVEIYNLGGGHSDCDFDCIVSVFK